MTVGFADLVGSTARAERLDPEDVRAILAPYYTRLRHELERHGGTVEKFIGDAVVGVFGAPAGCARRPRARRHRAALAIQEAIAELNEAEPALELEVRIGVNTGEALVALEARPEAGRAWCRAMSSTPRRGSSRELRRRDPRRRADASGDRASDRLRRARRAGEGRRSRSQRGWRCVATPATAELGDAGRAPLEDASAGAAHRCAGTRSQRRARS